MALGVATQAADREALRPVRHVEAMHLHGPEAGRRIVDLDELRGIAMIGAARRRRVGHERVENVGLVLGMIRREDTQLEVIDQVDQRQRLASGLERPAGLADGDLL